MCNEDSKEISNDDPADTIDQDEENLDWNQREAERIDIVDDLEITYQNS